MFRPSRLTPATRSTACVWVSPSSTWRLRSTWPNDMRSSCRYTAFTPSSSFSVTHRHLFSLSKRSGFPGFLLPVAVHGAARWVSGEHVQHGQSAAPAGPHTLGHSLLPEGPHAACTETGGLLTLARCTLVFITVLPHKIFPAFCPSLFPSPPPAGYARRAGGSEPGDRLQPLPHLPGQWERGDSPAAH